MRLATTLVVDDLTDADFRELGASENFILEHALETAGQMMLKLEELRWERFIRYCQTGQFE